jgi:hypothetical protein
MLIAITLAAAWAGPILMDGIVNYFFAPRQLLFAIPFLVLLAASGAYELSLKSGVWVPAVLVAVVLGGSLFSDYGQAVHSKDDLEVAARTVQTWVGPDGCMAVAPSNWAAYFTFFEPGLANRKCEGAPVRIVSVRAAQATTQDQQTLSMSVPPDYVKKKEAAFRDLNLTLYEPR